MKYCPYCNQMVSPVKRPSWFLFIFLSVITGGSWIFIYAIYYFLFDGLYNEMRHLKK